MNAMDMVRFHFYFDGNSVSGCAVADLDLSRDVLPVLAASVDSVDSLAAYCEELFSAARELAEAVGRGETPVHDWTTVKRYLLRGMGVTSLRALAASAADFSVEAQADCVIVSMRVPDSPSGQGWTGHGEEVRLNSWDAKRVA